MSAEALIAGLPDLVVLLRRDGVVLESGGGGGVPALRWREDARGKSLDALCTPATAAVLKQLARKAIASRTPIEARFGERGLSYEARVSAQGPERVLLIVRAAVTTRVDETLDGTGESSRAQLERRNFLRRCKESMASAALREKPLAMAVIHLDGIADVGQLFASKLSEQIMAAALQRLPAQAQSNDPDGKGWWYVGQLSDTLLALVIESSDREAIGSCVATVCASLREPVVAGGAEFHLTPYTGVAILGQDASSPKLLLDHAQAAAAEARRTASSEARFFTDTMQLKSLARLDIARELRQAIENGDIRLRYVGRHELAGGRLVAWVGYLRWRHPLRGEVRPAEFLRVAEATGLATVLSRAMLGCLSEDFAALEAGANADVRISFGALRHHVLQEEFAKDIEEFLAEGPVPVERLELRIAERALVARDAVNLERLGRLGVQLVVDEVARGMGSLDLLARAPIWGLQLDRAWVTALRNDPIARKVCRAGIGVAQALGLTPIATGVDDAEQREALVAMGCRHGSGDLFRDGITERMRGPRAAAQG
ncbi:MAG TPA: GGDEF domain-containing phosphodiesterase [Steroidobacteraceae bacterium]|nr:GGDEF domain-containing phosphodiesterase [Steroidobacteraceae bacterium]